MQPLHTYKVGNQGGEAKNLEAQTLLAFGRAIAAENLLTF